MALTVKHKKVSSRTDGADTSLVRPTDWNDTHLLESASNVVLGRVSSGTGAVEELTPAQTRTLLGVVEPGVLAGVNTRTASYTLVASDRGKVIEMNVASANSVTVPNETGIGGVNFPIGTQITVAQLGSGQTTLIPANGVTLKSVNQGLSTTTQYSAILLYKRSVNDWLVLNQPYADESAAAAAASATAAAISADLAAAHADDAASFAGYRDFKDVATMLANTSLTYTAGQAGTVQVGDIIRIRSNGFVYSVAASGATTHIATTAGGVKLSYSKRGYSQDGKVYRTGGGALRQSTSAGGWAFISDANHSPYGWSATTPVALSGTNLVVTYDTTMADVGQFSVAVDEDFTAIGLQVGASVGVSNAIIYGYAPISGRVFGGATGVAYSTTTGNVISQTVDQTNGTITVSHLTQVHTDSNGTAVVTSELGAPSAGRVTVASQTKSGFVLQFVRDLACRIACTDATPGAEVFTVTESSIVGPITAAWITGTNCVRVTYPTTGSAIPNAIVMGSRDAVTKYIVTIDTQGATTADIFFYDIATGAQITAATTSMIFYFMKAGNFPAPLPSSGTLGFVQRDMVPVDFNLLNGSSANLFVSYSHPL